MTRLKYKGQDLGFECQQDDDCACGLCGGIRMAIELMDYALCIAVENGLMQHIDWAAANLCGRIHAAREALTESDERVVH